jgi:hypothetical protein
MRNSSTKLAVSLAAGAAVTLVTTWGVAVPFLTLRPMVAASVLVAGLLLVGVGLGRGERFTRTSFINTVPLIIAGLMSLLSVTILGGAGQMVWVAVAGWLCLAASGAVVVAEKNRRFLAAGIQTVLLLYIWGLTPLWGMAIADNWL